MTEQYQITLDVDVDDKAALREAAKKEALKTMSAEDWEDLRSSNFSDVAADLHMLLDPGYLPGAGFEISNGEVTFVGNYGDDGQEQDDNDPDYEGAARREGWAERDGLWRHTPPKYWSDGSGELTYDTAEECCRMQHIEVKDDDDDSLPDGAPGTEDLSL